jgi:hypothetical protein
VARVLFDNFFFMRALLSHWSKHVSGQKTTIQHGSIKQLSLCIIFSRHQDDIWPQHFVVGEMVLANHVVTGSYITQTGGCVSLPVAF